VTAVSARTSKSVESIHTRLRVVGGYWHAEIEGDFAIVASEESNNEAGEAELLERVASMPGEQESFSHECS
jgi:hypothetical protein